MRYHARRALSGLTVLSALLCVSGCACFVSDAPLYREGATPGDLGMFPTGCRQVEVLSGSAFDDAAFRRIYPNLKARSVEALNLQSTRVTDESLELICKLKSLRWLNLEDTPVTPAGIARLHALAPQLEIVR